MSLKELIKGEDLNIFLDTDEFADDATFEENPIKVLYDKVSESDYSIDIVNCKISDVPNIKTSSKIVVNSIAYTCSSWIPREGIMEIVINKVENV